jgi:hypothetical protein
MRTFFAADFDSFPADFYRNGIRIELAVASRTSFLSHDIPPIPEVRAGLVGHGGGEMRCQNL